MTRGEMVVAGAAALAIALSASSASACRFLPGTPPPPPNETGVHWGAAIATVAAVEGAFVAGQLVANEDLFPDWLAAIELGIGIAGSVGAIVIATYATLSGSSSCDADPWPRYGLWSSPALAAVSGWMIAHAIWSLVSPRPLEGAAIGAAPALAITSEGAQLVVVGSF